MLNYYKNYLNHLSKTPNEEYRSLQQAIIDSCWDNTTILETIQEESEDFNFHSIDVWFGTVTDAITNTEKDVADYRYLYFKDCEHISPRGKYYYFDKNYWIVYESSTKLESQANCKIRRCNNKLKWIDKNNGKIIEYPCILDYTLASPNMQVTKDINTANGHVTVIIQGNKETLKLEKNQRFIFNGIPYRYTAINNYMQNNYVDENVPLLFLDCFLDSKQPKDDLINNIANMNDYDYKIKILEESFEQNKGFKGKLNAIVTLNNKEVKRNIIWQSSNNDIVKIDRDGNYELIGNDEEECYIYAIIENSNTSSEIKIGIKNELNLKNDIIITPLISELGLYSTVEFKANLYKDGIKQNDKVDCIPSGVDDSCFVLIDNGDNTFKLGNNKTSVNPLKLTFKCKEYEEYEETIEIILGSLF